MRRATLLIPLMLCAASVMASPPRLVVNIVVGSLREADLTRLEDNLQGGLARLMSEGAHYTEAYYDYALTTTAAGLATITTGVEPAIHGAVGEQWWSHVDGSHVELIADHKAYPVEFSIGAANVSPHLLATPTLGDMLLNHNPKSKHLTIAIDDLSAIVLNGRQGVAYWAENNNTLWTTSSAYSDKLPAWVTEYNRAKTNTFYTLTRWTPLLDITRYHNSEVAVVEGIVGKSTQLLSDINLRLTDTLYGKMRYTPAGNTMLIEFASSLIAQEHLGQDDATDILNLSLDTATYIAQTYGTESIEYEDMLYRLDSDLAEFMTYIYAQCPGAVIVLSSPHGTSPSYNPAQGAERERLNTRQMEVIVNAFLGARYGSDNYILGYANNALYLNHAVLHAKKLSVEDIREEVATFLLQMRGVSTALSASKLRNSTFSEGRNRLVQRSYCPTRSGDVIIDLLPGWCVERSGIRSASDAGYNYDRHVPLIIYGPNIRAQEIERTVSIEAVAPTIATLVGMEIPWASMTRPLTEVIK